MEAYVHERVCVCVCVCVRACVKMIDLNNPLSFALHKIQDRCYKEVNIALLSSLKYILLINSCVVNFTRQSNEVSV